MAIDKNASMPPTVNGKPVTEFSALFKPAAYLVTSKDGVHEMTRCYFHDGKYSVGFGTSRLGGLECLGVQYEPGRGCLVAFSKGYTIFVSERDCQITWR